MMILRKHEYQILSVLQKLGEETTIEKIVINTGFSESLVMRAILSLQEKKLVKLYQEKETIITLTREGRLSASKGLLERIILKKLYKKDKFEVAISEISEEVTLSQDMISIALGWLIRKKWAEIDKERGLIKAKERVSPPYGDDEKLIHLLNEKGLVVADKLKPQLQKTIPILKGRKLLDIREKTKKTIVITDFGQKQIEKGIKISVEITQLTPKLITSGNWRKGKFQKYNIKSSVTKTFLGKKHPYLRFLDNVKEKLITLGFKEMTGPIVEESFFNFDALYMPQDHPAREIFGIYFLKSLKYGSLKDYKKILDNVKKTHETGWNTGSSGWRYKYSKKAAKRLILRGHGTCLSVRMLLNKKLKIPGKYFSIVRCYRPEILDKTHLTEFNQVEGIIIDKDLTLRDLLGVLEQFAFEIADADDVKFRPDYFPFTEPSVELNAYKEGYGWLEFGGSGIFRPEVTKPLGINTPVIAWGLGIDRLFMMKAEIDDIRKIFTNDLNWLRNRQVI
jgi:phenylalanyl-tRNA synthetase alpha chain